MRTLKKSEEKAVSCGMQRWGMQQKRLAYIRFKNTTKKDADSGTYCQEYVEHTLLCWTIAHSNEGSSF